MPHKFDKWTNNSNAQFYEGVPIAVFENFSRAGGLSQGCDLNLIFPRMKKAGTILEIGAGYGRVLQHLLEQKHLIAEIHAVEKSDAFCTVLKERFRDDATIHHCDIASFCPAKKFDTILWLWSGISDFPKTDQLPLLKKIAPFLAKDGLLVIDTLIHNKSLNNATVSDVNVTMYDQQYEIKIQDNTICGYMPSVEEMLSYAKECGFCKAEHFLYQTETGLSRNLFFLSEPQ